MATITVNRGESTGIPFTITDVAGGLVGKRVTWSIQGTKGKRLIKKASALPGSSAEITITSQTASLITGVIHLLVADFAKLYPNNYEASLWVDDGSSDLCVTPNGIDTLIVGVTAPRRP